MINNRLGMSNVKKCVHWIVIKYTRVGAGP